MHLLYKTQIRYLFHTDIKIKIPDFYDDFLFDEFYSILYKTGEKYNSFNSGSYIDKINKNSGDYVNVDDETVKILGSVILISDFFEGKYDITIMPLLRLWGFYKIEQYSLPDFREIQKTKELVNYKKIEIKGNNVKINKGQEIVTGSFIKAYAVDLLNEYMRNKGISDAIINAGGSTVCAINNDVHHRWQIIVRNPDTEKELFKLNLTNKCYSTTGQKNTYVEIEGKKYGHILNAKTGTSSCNKQIGIITDNCFFGDIISTALFNETSETFLNKINQLSKYNVDGYLIDSDGKITYTNNFLEKYRY